MPNTLYKLSKLPVLLFLLFELNASNCYSQAQTENIVVKKYIDSFITSIKNKGVKEYLVYKITCGGECVFPKECKCEHEDISNATIIYKINVQCCKKNIDCCNQGKSIILDSAFFTFVSKSGKKLAKSTGKTIKFYPPIATDQVMYDITYNSEKTKFDFTLSQNQITVGTDEQKVWSKIVKYKIQKQIFDFVNHNL